MRVLLLCSLGLFAACDSGGLVGSVPRVPREPEDDWPGDPSPAPLVEATARQGIGRDVAIELAGDVGELSTVRIEWAGYGGAEREAETVGEGAAEAWDLLPDPCGSFRAGYRDGAVVATDGAWRAPFRLDLAGDLFDVSAATEATRYTHAGLPLVFCGSASSTLITVEVEAGYRFERVGGEFLLQSGAKTANMGRDMNVPAGLLEIVSIDLEPSPYALIVDRL
jgi:hypothetical protein